LIFPTFFGPDNIPPLEAFVLGCPVIASRLSGSEEHLGDAAQLFDPAKPQEIADAIAAVCGPGYRTARLRNRLIKKGFKLALRRSSLDYVRNVCEILDEFEPVRRCWPAA
jgi:glycosyltransferase involved in cell wall biosynthesis